MTPEEISQLRAEKYNATVARLERVHPDLLIMRIRPDAPRPAPKPGQYMVLGMGYWEPRHAGCQAEQLDELMLPRLARRSYSISCSILDGQGELLDIARTDWLEFYVVLVRNSGKSEAPVLTPRLFLLEEGSRLHLGEKIVGHYTLEGVKPDDTVIFLSTGTGEAPHNYMLWELLRNRHRGRILSACCVRYGKDLGYRAIHDELMGRHPNYSYLSLTTREGPGAGGKVYIQDLIASGDMERQLGRPLDPETTHVFLCGNPKMIGVAEKNRETGEVRFPSPPGVIELLTRRGFQTDIPAQKLRGNIHYEEYW